MTIVEMDLLSNMMENRHTLIEGLTESQKSHISQYFVDMRENLTNYCKNGKRKILSIMRDA